MKIEWVEQVIPGHQALATVAYFRGKPLAVIDQCIDEGKHVFAVFLCTNPRQAACIAECLEDAKVYVERAVSVAVAS